MTTIGRRPSLDINVLAPFGEVRTAGPFTLVELTHQYHLDPLVWGTDTTGSGAVTHDQQDAAIRLAVSAANGDSACIQTHRYYHPIAGLGMRILQAAAVEAPNLTDQRIRAGVFDTNNGLFWEIENNVSYLVKRSDASGSVIDTKVNSTQGNVPGAQVPFSKINPANLNSLAIDYLWEGVGEIVWLYNGRPIHIEQLQNKSPLPFLPHGNLPFRYEIENIGPGASTNAVRIYAGTALLYGGGGPPLKTTALGINTTWSGSAEHVVFSVRPGANFKSHVFHGDVLPKLLGILADADVEFSVYLNVATLTGASWAAHSPDFALELDTSATAYTGGTKVFGGLSAAAATASRDLSDIFAIGGRTLTNLFPSGQDTLTVTLRRTQGGASTIADLEFLWGELQ